MEYNRIKEILKIYFKKVVIVEGILIFIYFEIREMFDIKLFVYVDSDECLIRRLKRDILECGRDLKEVFNCY